MSSVALKRFATVEPAVCVICRREADGPGFTPKKELWKHPPRHFWCCDGYSNTLPTLENSCYLHLPRVCDMTDAQFTGHEDKAIREAGERAGAFLDKLGETDLARLSEEQYHDFLRQVVIGVETGLKRQFRNGELPW